MKKTTALLVTLLFASSFAMAQAPAAPPPPAAVPVAITDADLKNVETPKADARLKGDPDGALTGTVSDIAVGDAKKGMSIGDVANQIGQNKIAINFVYRYQLRKALLMIIWMPM